MKRKSVFNSYATIHLSTKREEIYPSSESTYTKRDFRHGRAEDAHLKTL
jgi:hypothetical protein